ncbi:MAG: CinA family protein [Alloprevotella sp.]|nr:CinA family protein [Bacteroidales bacterium]MCI6728014.1 CinA family protein [Bacteroidales bacterium]MDY4740545.1 CinA family protein [Alloprevotella sp.]
MDLDLKLVSKEINEMMWRNHKTLATAESCTAGRVASVITAVPGSSNYYKGGLVCYADEVKIQLLKVDADVIAEKTPVCEEVVRQMVIGANELFHTDYAVAISGFAGPGGPDGGRSGVIVGTIWIAVGTKDDVVTTMIEEDNGRDKNLASATSVAMHLLRDYLKEHMENDESEA